jgi:hypothetical protein
MFSITALEILPSFKRSLKIACLNAGIKSSAFGDNPTINLLFSLKQPSVAIMWRCGLKFKKSPNVCIAQTMPGVALSRNSFFIINSIEG